MTTIPLRALRPEWNHAARILLSVLTASEPGAERRWPGDWFVGGNYAIPPHDAMGRRLAEALYAAGKAPAGSTPFTPDKRPALTDADLVREVLLALGSPETVLEIEGVEVRPVEGPPIRLRPSQIRGTRPADPGDPVGTVCVISYTGTPEAPSQHGPWTHVAVQERSSEVLGRMGL